MVLFFVPSLLRPFCGGEARVAVEPGSLEQVLRAVDRRCPGFFDRAVAEGRVRPELAVAIDGEIRSLALFEPIHDGAEITLVPAIGGG